MFQSRINKKKSTAAVSQSSRNACFICLNVDYVPLSSTHSGREHATEVLYDVSLKFHDFFWKCAYVTNLSQQHQRFDFLKNKVYLPISRIYLSSTIWATKLISTVYHCHRTLLLLPNARQQTKVYLILSFRWLNLSLNMPTPLSHECVKINGSLFACHKGSHIWQLDHIS